jgi:hypothetical protein
VVVPVHVFDKDSEGLAEPCWIRGKVTKSDTKHELARIQEPENWELLPSKPDAGELFAGPHIVHLSGAPLLSLRALDQPADGTEVDSAAEACKRELAKALEETSLTGGSSARSLDPSRISIEHAIFADEYLALRHAQIDLFYQFSRITDAKLMRSDRSLPRLLTSASAVPTNSRGDNPRFWLVVGVALADPAIRYRLISQLSLRRVDTDGFEPRGRRDSSNGGGNAAVGCSDPDEEMAALFREPVHREDQVEPSFDEFSGVVVNWRISDDEAATFYWLGFDVIKDRADCFIPDVVHYTEHLGEGGWKHWPSPNEFCKVGTTSKSGTSR